MGAKHINACFCTHPYAYEQSHQDDILPAAYRRENCVLLFGRAGTGRVGAETAGGGGGRGVSRTAWQEKADTMRKIGYLVPLGAPAAMYRRAVYPALGRAAPCTGGWAQVVTSHTRP